MANCSSTKSSIQPINLDTAKDAVQKYYELGEYDRECKSIIDNAIEYINSLTIKNNSAVVFDVDDTALSNYDLTKEIGFGYIYKLWYEWIQNGKAPAIKETKRFYDYLISKNIHIIFLTGRYAEMIECTHKNLKEQGFAKYDTLIVRSSSETKMAAAEYKSQKRNDLVKKGYDIIACIGDQQSDLTGSYTGYKIKLPDYLYLID